MGFCEKYIYKSTFKEGVSVFSLLTGRFCFLFRTVERKHKKPIPPNENLKYIYIYFFAKIKNFYTEKSDVIHLLTGCRKAFLYINLDFYLKFAIFFIDKII